ncbi:MAG: CHAT domain-containing protein [Phycisphaerae bacterium]|nr:CHAT domain-containing protein [Saprospiraceae bacterium]
MKEANEINLKKLGPNHPDFIKGVANIGSVYCDQRAYRQALQFLHNAEQSIESISLIHKELYADILGNIGLAYQSLQDIPRAEEYFNKALEIRKKFQGEAHPEYAAGLMNLAEIYLLEKKPEAAKHYLEQSIEIFSRTSGTDHNYHLNAHYIQACNYLAYPHLFEHEKPVTDFFERQIKRLHRNASFLSAEELQRFSLKRLSIENRLFTFLKNRQISSGPLVEASYDNALCNRSLLLQSHRSLHNYLRHSRVDSITFDVYGRWKGFQKRMAQEYASTNLNLHTLELLQNQSDSLEKILIRQVAGFSAFQKTTQWQDVHKALQPNEAAIEFVRFDYGVSTSGDSVYYGALLIRPDQSGPQFIPLFSKEKITPLIQYLNGSNFKKINVLYQNHPGSKQEKNLFDLIWKPLLPALKGIKKIYYAPMGLLHRLNLGAIKSGPNTLVSDQFQLIMLSSTRALTEPVRPSNNAAQDAYLAGGLRYASGNTDAVQDQPAGSERGYEQTMRITGFYTDSTIRGGGWSYLPESKTEVLLIKKLMEGAGFHTQLDSGHLATETSFRILGNTQKSSPTVIHLATHGYFFPESPQSPQYLPGGTESAFKLSDNPMIRTGLIMSGANPAWLGQKQSNGADDGILTAFEIAQLNLANTDLVALSACETALGDIIGYEGVFGLQRAFKIAGARYIICSLWKVNDQTTRELMTAFYRAWLEEKRPVPNAFQAAQKELRRKYPDSPYHWAGFVLLE